MKKLVALVVSLACLLTLVACGGSASSGPADLIGDWKQSNSNSDESYMSATITSDTIEVYWVSDAGKTTSLYWAGTYVAPTDGAEPYSWDSENDTDKTSVALLASPDATKTFTYEKGKISYSVSMMGTTTTVELERTSK